MKKEKSQKNPSPSASRRGEKKFITENISFNVVPQLKKAIQADLDKRAQEGESVTTTDWLHEAIIKKLEEDNPELVRESEFFQLPDQWKEIANPGLIDQQYPCNTTALSQLKKEKTQLAIETGLTGVLGMTAGLFNTIGFGLLALAYRPLSRLAQVSRVIEVLENLLNQYSEEEIRVFPSIPVSSTQPIDLLIIFPKQLLMIVSIRLRTNAEREIKYEPSEQTLYARHQRKGLYKISPSPLAEFKKYQKWLSEDSNFERFQLTSNDLNKYPIHKVLLLWPPTIIDKESKDFRFIFTDGKISANPLCVVQEEKTFIIEKKKFFDLLKLCKDAIIT